MTQLASETQSRLEAQVLMERAEKDAAVEHLRREMRTQHLRHDAEIAGLTEVVRAVEQEKEAVEEGLRGRLHRTKLERDEEVGALRGRHTLSTPSPHPLHTPPPTHTHTHSGGRAARQGPPPPLHPAEGHRRGHQGRAQDPVVRGASGMRTRMPPLHRTMLCFSA